MSKMAPAPSPTAVQSILVSAGGDYFFIYAVNREPRLNIVLQIVLLMTFFHVL